MQLNEAALEQWKAQLNSQTIHIYWDGSNKVKTEFVPFFMHANPSLLFLSSVANIKQNYLVMNDGILADKCVLDGKLCIIPCKNEMRAMLLLIKVLGSFYDSNYNWIFMTETCELSDCIKDFIPYGGLNCKVINRHLHQNIRNQNKSRYDTIYDAIYEAILVLAKCNGHPVISNNEFCEIFKSCEFYLEIFNHFIENELLIADKSLKLSKLYELKEYDEDFTFKIIGSRPGRITTIFKEILGNSILSRLSITE